MLNLFLFLCAKFTAFISHSQLLQASRSQHKGYLYIPADDLWIPAGKCLMCIVTEAKIIRCLDG